jgi:hypothetical protein
MNTGIRWGGYFGQDKDQTYRSDLGEQVRNRFEQIFYGLTVSEEVPCITFFTGKNDISRHKFFTNNVRTKTPFIDIPMWSSWWTKSKPQERRRTMDIGMDTNDYKPWSFEVLEKIINKLVKHPNGLDNHQPLRSEED